MKDNRNLNRLTPDYKRGIELKSRLENRSSKKNVLFTQMPDLDISSLKSGNKIVVKYGNLTDDGKRIITNQIFGLNYDLHRQ